MLRNPEDSCQNSGTPRPVLERIKSKWSRRKSTIYVNQYGGSGPEFTVIIRNLTPSGVMDLLPKILSQTQVGEYVISRRFSRSLQVIPNKPYLSLPKPREPSGSKVDFIYNYLQGLDRTEDNLLVADIAWEEHLEMSKT